MKINFFIFSIIFIFVTFSLNHTFAQTPEAETVDFSLDADSLRSYALDQALKCINMNQSDLVLRADYLDIDSFRLDIINHLMQNPLSTTEYSESLGAELLSYQSSLTSLLNHHIASLGYHFDSETVKVQPMELEDAILAFLEKTESKLSKDQKEAFKKAKYLPRDLRRTLALILSAMIDARKELASALEYLSKEELEFLKENFPILLQDDVEDEFKSAEQLDFEEKYEEEISREMIPTLKKVKLEKILNAGMILSGATQRAFALVKDIKITDPMMIKKDVLLSLKSSYGDIYVGNKVPNRYNGSYAIIIDLGGDDEYSFSSSEKANLSVLIDLGGDDQYKTKDFYNLGSGFFGVGILWDRSGDDNYQASNFSLGSGLFGVGILLDQGGHDKYFGDTFTQGAGSFGIGVLSDVKGNDQYSGALFAQGFAFVSGFGSLIDSSGNDSYSAGNKYKDILRYEDHYLSLSQGFSYGLRPLMSGGIGFLFDYSGNDTYISDIFGQGSSYWWALGALVDCWGNDKYVSFQYAQGAGTHMTLGVLIDENGDDVYISKGVSQGCGHDLALGILLDKSGDDSYSAYDLSQGAGSANGIGIIIDDKGDDSYTVKRTHNTQGYGNPRRDYGSVGLFLDLSGKDWYAGNGKDSTWWVIPSKWGAGIDGEFFKIKN
ncbi:MAG: hypothetical protein AMJ90_00225 [candidate division Zixibacteria bacterium SM23_73_2]|nr:MAG: hypothetical protein AMJ90_00225 [candidate division Zixibacteria bacterium SM23_73_2]